jgi:hypothetical protein
MSKMADLELEIRDMIERGFFPPSIAKILDIPLGMVYDVLENWEEPKGNAEIFSPFVTINS